MQPLVLFASRAPPAGAAAAAALPALLAALSAPSVGIFRPGGVAQGLWRQRLAPCAAPGAGSALQPRAWHSSSALSEPSSSSVTTTSERASAQLTLSSLVNYEQRGIPANAGVASGSAFDLGRMRRLLAALGDPHRGHWPAVHVAGSKGKRAHHRST